MTCSTIPSPCIRNCCLNDEDICLGCFRSLSEIMSWAEADNEKRLQIMENTRKRQLGAHLRKESLVRKS